MRIFAIVVLGAPNDENGNLSSIAVERCHQGYAEFLRHPDAFMLTTGGRGAHFNTTNKPHALYTRRALMAMGVPEDRFLESAESVNTIEDARLARPILDRHGVTDVIVVTSDFHMPRARFLFEREFPDRTLVFSAAPTRLPEEEIVRLKRHEEGALARLKQTV